MNKCELLAITDGFVCQKYFEGRFPAVEPLIDTISAEEFELLRQQNRYVDLMYRKLCKAYGRAISECLSFDPDQYGGYGLVFCGDKELHQSQVLDAAIGYFEKLPKDRAHHVRNVSVLAPTDLCSFERLMVGPVRFANHSCKPNCEYLASEDEKGRRCVKLRTLVTIPPGEFLTVFYGVNFFDTGNINCLCPYSMYHGSGDIADSAGTHDVSVLSGFNVSIPTVIANSRNIAPSRSNLKRRIVFKEKRIKKKRRLNSEMRRYSSSTDSESLDTEMSLVMPFYNHMEHSVSVSDLLSSPDEVFEDLKPVFQSTPVPTINLSSDMSSDSTESDNSCEENNVEVFRGVTMRNLLVCAQSIVTKHSTSDAEARDWFNLIRIANQDAKIPSYKTVKRKLKCALEQSVVDRCSSGRGDWISLDFKREIFEIVSRNFETIVKYEADRIKGEDLILPSALDTSSLRVFLLLNSDGVQIIQSRSKSLWPVWLAIANLPPRMRCAFNNIVLGALWFGVGKPDWNFSLQRMIDILYDGREFVIEKGSSKLRLTFEVVLLVADMPAKSSMLNMKQHNGFFGCTLCLTKGKRHGFVHYYENRDAKMRSNAQHLRSLKFLDNNPTKASSRGVKGKSKLFEIIPHLPLTAPVDYMHQVLLGVTKVLLKDVMVKEVGVKRIAEMNVFISRMKLPFEIKRAVRGLDELPHFKASEYKTWLLYIGPVLLLNCVSQRNYDRFMLLSYAVRLLLCNVKYSTRAGRLLKLFLDKTQEDYSQESFTPNVHALSHLSWQVSCYGPLWATSAIMFESANYLLKSSFTGTVRHLELVIERYLRRKDLIEKPVNTDALTDVISNLLGKKNSKYIAGAVDLTRIPESFKSSIGSRKLLGSQLCGELMLDSFYSQKGDKNSYVSFSSTRTRFFGQIQAFVEDDNAISCIVKLFRVNQSYKCPVMVKADLVSYVDVETSDELIELPIHKLDFKCLKIVKTPKTYLVPILRHFEHD